MTAKDLLNITFDNLISKIQANIGLNQFVLERSKFEGWLKVELIDTLCKNQIVAKPEVNRIDVSFKNTAIELKTINTNYRLDNVANKTRPITKNINGVLKDIWDLKKQPIENKFVIFIVFPLDAQSKKWKIHLEKIRLELKELVWKDFHFENGVPSTIYVGKV